MTRRLLIARTPPTVHPLASSSTINKTQLLKHPPVHLAILPPPPPPPGEEDKQEEVECESFMDQFLAELLGVHQARDKWVRFRVCQVVCKLLFHASTIACVIDADLLEATKEIMLVRAFDKVRRKGRESGLTEVEDVNVIMVLASTHVHLYVCVCDLDSVLLYNYVLAFTCKCKCVYRFGFSLTAR